MIDVHQHMLPPEYRRWLTRNGTTHDGFPVPEWSAERALETMHRLGIEKAYLSVSSPGLAECGDGDALSMARDVNDFAAAMVRENGGRLHYFALLPPRDGAAAAAEAARALDECSASGVALLANTDGIYLGDDSQRELMRVLDDRGAVVFVHPTSLPGGPAEGIPPFAADFLLDTTRAAIRLVSSGTVAAFPRIRFILPHAGGFLPYAATRIARTTAKPPQDWARVMDQLKSFYFDLAMSATETVLPSLLSFVGADHVLVGSDFPYAPAEPIAANFAAFAAYPLKQEVREMIEQGAARGLFAKAG